jgi:N-acetyltransferase
LEEIPTYLQQLVEYDETILPFVTVLKTTGKIVGTTRFLNIDRHNCRLEIGHTWIAKSYRRSFVNTEAKFLMLQHAFENLNCIAVEIRTDILNEVSRKAIERLGAKQDGILRNHKIMRDGRIRNTVCYIIIKEEWTDVKMILLQKINN